MVARCGHFRHPAISSPDHLTWEKEAAPVIEIREWLFALAQCPTQISVDLEFHYRVRVKYPGNLCLHDRYLVQGHDLRDSMAPRDLAGRDLAPRDLASRDLACRDCYFAQNHEWSPQIADHQDFG